MLSLIHYSHYSYSLSSYLIIFSPYLLRTWAVDLAYSPYKQPHTKHYSYPFKPDISLQPLSARTNTLPWLFSMLCLQRILYTGTAHRVYRVFDLAIRTCPIDFMLLGVNSSIPASYSFSTLFIYSVHLLNQAHLPTPYTLRVIAWNPTPLGLNRNYQTPSAEQQASRDGDWVRQVNSIK